MPITTADIKLLASQVMADVPEGGGAPTANIIPDGASNALFPDISESARAGGRIYIRQVSASIQSTDTAVYMDGNVIVASPPNDPNVSITLFKAPGVFARRTAVANAIESYLVRGPMLGAYLLENHVINMRRIELLQRPGSSLPPVGRTLVLVLNEGTATEVVQFVRTTRVESEVRTFTESTGQSAIDFQAEVVRCDISDKLRYNFPGSPASRGFAGQVGKTIVRNTTVADAGSYAGVVGLRLPLTLGDSTLFVSSIYTQLVPNARTESIALDQKPAAQRPITLATTPRLVTVSVAPHAMRIKVGQENRGFSFTQILRPLPAPNTVLVSYRALGNWYTLQDDGSGVLTGSGVGTVNYLTGSIAITTPSLPDVNSSIIFSWGEKTGFVNRSGQAGFRAPEFALQLPHDSLKPATVTVTWLSGGVLKTATANAQGVLSGRASGEVNHATGAVFLRPLDMIDAGGEFAFAYERAPTLTKSVTVAPDAGGFASITLDDVPVAGSVAVRWQTVRQVSTSSGASSGGAAAGKNGSATTTTTTTATVVLPPGAPGDVTRIPVSLTRVPLTGSGASAVDSMQPGGTRLLNGQQVFIAVKPEFDAAGYFYSVPDVTGVTWSEDELGKRARFKPTAGKFIGLKKYYVWNSAEAVGSTTNVYGANEIYN